MLDTSSVLLVLGVILFFAGLINSRFVVLSVEIPELPRRARIAAITLGSLMLAIGLGIVMGIVQPRSPNDQATQLPTPPLTPTVTEPPSTPSPGATVTVTAPPVTPSTVVPSVPPTPTTVLTEPSIVAGEYTPPVPSFFDRPLQPDQIGIVIQVNLSGDGKERGQETLNSAVLNLATQMAQLPSSIRDRVVVRYVDDGGDPDRAAAVAQQVREDQKGVVCVMGLNRSTTADKAVSVYDEVHMSSIAVSATNAKLNSYPNHVFRSMVATDEDHGAFVASEIEALKAKKVAVVYIQDLYGTALASAAVNDLNNLHLPVSSIPLNTTNITTTVNQIDPATDLVFFAGYYNQAVDFFPIVRTKLPNAQLLGSDGIDNNKMVNAWPSIDGMLYTGIGAPIEEGSANPKFPALAALAQSYRNTYTHAIPPTYLGESYDAMGLCIRLIAYANEHFGGTSREQVYQALGAVTKPGASVPGVAGPYMYNAEGKLTNPAYYIRKATSDWEKNPIVPLGAKEPPPHG